MTLDSGRDFVVKSTVQNEAVTIPDE